MGLVQMGIVQSVEIIGGSITVRLLPTFPGCIYTAVFANEIRDRLGELAWASEIKVDIAHDGSLWDEDRMSADARTRLARARQERRRSHGLVVN